LSWLLAYAPVLVFGLAFLTLVRRRVELADHARSYRTLAEAKERGSHKARLQHPSIDLSHCIGCGACVRACPEEGVLSLLHGQAAVVHGARCVGHGLCAAACPTGAIALTLGDLSDRRDLPALNDDLEAVGVPGLFLAGELGGFALVRTAVTQGVAVADAVARRAANGSAARPAATPEPNGKVGLLVVGAGPGGLACSLRARELGLDFVTIEQEDCIGGTVAGYPRRKLVMTQPVHLPLHGRLPRLTYQKEELVELWEGLASANELPVRTGVRLLDLEREPDGDFLAQTSEGTVRARHVCLALGRRGTPRKLDVPGEGLAKVAHSLLDAESYQGRRILVVGGGDSAVEAALGLAEQPGNEVTLSYRKKALFRLKARNESRIRKALHDGRVRGLFESDVAAIEEHQVRLRVGTNGQVTETALPNDDVFIFAGGVPPFGMLEKASVSFDPADRPPPAGLVERGTDLLVVLAVLLAGAGCMTWWAVRHWSYYGLEPGLRGGSALHAWLRPAGPVGLAFGLAAGALFAWNLAYLLRRSPRWGRLLPGNLKLWMSSHVMTGLLALLCVLVHAGFTAKDTVGGHALIALAVVVVTGTIGRYLYSYVPRAANGREEDLDNLRARLAALSGEWDRDGRGFGAQVRDRVDKLIAAGRWRAGLLARIGALVIGQIRLRLSLRRLRSEGRRRAVPQHEIDRMLMLARRAYRLTLLVTHYEEVRAVLSSWRYFHRWLALLMVLLATVHIVTAVRFAEIEWAALVGGGGP
jgi:thioredoxin reductase/Pyruvate/2-oxoacid:ferredoxin oxidoreductase delta subunit